VASAAFASNRSLGLCNPAPLDGGDVFQAPAQAGPLIGNRFATELVGHHEEAAQVKTLEAKALSGQPHFVGVRLDRRSGTLVLLKGTSVRPPCDVDVRRDIGYCMF
jgi:hypothetical protein